jgi:hypothetical protein
MNEIGQDRRDDPEWDVLEQLWRTEERAAGFDEAALRRRIGAQTRRMWYIVAFEVVIVFASLIASFVVARQNPTRFTIGWTIGVWVYTILVWEFATWNRRGVWKPYGETAAAFVQLLKERAKRKLRVVWFSRAVIIIADVVFIPIAVSKYQARGAEQFEWAAWIVFVVYSASVLIWSVWYRRQAEREREEATQLERILSA